VKVIDYSVFIFF